MLRLFINERKGSKFTYHALPPLLYKATHFEWQGLHWIHKIVQQRDITKNHQIKTSCKYTWTFVLHISKFKRAELLRKLMESEFPKNMHIYIQCILSWIPTKFGEISCSVLRRVVVLKYWDWQTSGLIDWLTDGRIKNMYTPRNFLHGLRKADEWYTMVVPNKVIALGWSQETTDRQTFYKETGFWSHRSNLSALSP